MASKTIFIHDYETDGIKTATCNSVEYACVLWDIERKKPLDMVSELIYRENLGPEADKALSINKITREDLIHFGKPHSVVMDKALPLLHYPGNIGILAHNGMSFDHELLKRELAMIGSELPVDVPLLDTFLHVPPEYRRKSQAWLAAENPIRPFVNPFPHRSITDCLTLGVISTDLGVDTLLYYQRQRIAYLVALNVLPPWEDGGASNALAREAGFRWNPQHDPHHIWGPKKWVAEVYECEFDQFLRSNENLPISFDVKYDHQT
jgi:DNA polymerase-3 subunit epsilon